MEVELTEHGGSDSHAASQALEEERMVKSSFPGKEQGMISLVGDPNPKVKFPCPL